MESKPLMAPSISGGGQVVAKRQRDHDRVNSTIPSWLEGVQLLAVYLISAAVFYSLPDAALPAGR
jgi:hypothetical protein